MSRPRGVLRTYLPGIRRIAIGADHGGFALKATLITFLQARGLEVADLGTHSPEPCDYPTIGYKVAAAVARGAFDRGILLCKSGIGIAIVANKVPGIRAAVCGDTVEAERSRSHNDTNIVALGAETLSDSSAKRIVERWLSTPFESGGRHERRVRQIAAIEKAVGSRPESESRKKDEGR
ncbi:MAG: ribose 5-phosphate isomerase B [Candidatus Omnitrophica bacterium]|nr:ribose 5-phosphate isomerase B [Candidatus Omnitrophota bacterium]